MFYIKILFCAWVCLKVHKREIFYGRSPILNFVLFHSWFCLNIKVLQKHFFDWAIIGGDTIVPLVLRLRGIGFSLI
jgi:hypothetical protein